MITITDSNTSSNSAEFDIGFVSLQSEEAELTGSGIVYHVVSDLAISFLSFTWEIDGLTNYNPISGSSLNVMGDTYYVIDGEMTRLSPDESGATTMTNYLTLTQGVHTLSLLYMGVSGDGNFIFDIETIFVEVRESSDDFGFDLAEVNLLVDFTDTYYPKPIGHELQLGDDRPNRVLSEGIELDSADYDSNTNELSLSGSFNSSGSLGYQNSTGHDMSRGRLFFADASGIYPLTPSTEKIIVYDSDYTTLGLYVMRDGGFNVDDWEGISDHLQSSYSFDVIIEDTNILFNENEVKNIDSKDFDREFGEELELFPVQVPVSDTGTPDDEPGLALLPIPIASFVTGLLLIAKYRGRQA